ncbi:hypothetical protein IM711_10925 [Microbacterium esteraromaticum]|uniref:hypothetical protein n=1 Tax=Microbacterium esteraromaticum TaxID=57043 RepID=UPI003C30AC9A
MSKPSVDELLRGSTKSYEPSIVTRAALESLVDASRAEAARTRVNRRRRSFWLIPGAVVAAGALTAGAALFAPHFDPDVRIPIEYATDTGVEVTCTYALRVGSVVGGENPQLREWLASQDWSGVGQRIYEDAVANPFVPGEDDEGEWTAEIVDSVSFFDAMARQIAVPDGLAVFGDEVAGTSDCTGQLH